MLRNNTRSFENDNSSLFTRARALYIILTLHVFPTLFFFIFSSSASSSRTFTHGWLKRRQATSAGFPRASKFFGYHCDISSWNPHLWSARGNGYKTRLTIRKSLIRMPHCKDRHTIYYINKMQEKKNKI